MRRRIVTAVVASCAILLLGITAYAQLPGPALVSPLASQGNTSVSPTFEWQAVPGATWYQVWVSETGDPNTPVILQWVNNALTYTTAEVLTPANSYSWWVQPWSATLGNGLWSSEGQFTVATPPTTNFISINAAAFAPYDDGYNFRLYYGGAALEPQSNPQEWIAPLNLPNGANVKEVTLFYYNDGGGAAVASPTLCWLDRSKFDSSNREHMTMLEAAKDDGFGSITINSITNPVVDNMDYSYFLRCRFPDVKNWLIHVRLGYEEP